MVQTPQNRLHYPGHKYLCVVTPCVLQNMNIITSNKLRTIRNTLLLINSSQLHVSARGLDSSVSIATRYGLDGPWIESRWEWDFPHPFRSSPGPHPASYTGCPRRNVPNFGRVFLMLKYTDITQNTYVQVWTVTEIMAREVWNFDSCYKLIDYQIHIKTDRDMWFL